MISQKPQTLRIEEITSGFPAEALDRGYTIPGLMSEALRLYLRMGFVPCEPFGENPVEMVTCLVKYQ